LIRIGTRGSALALAQAAWVAERVDGDTELVTVASSTDVGDKSRWVSGLERALLADEIDFAVHSAKDVPVELPEDLELIAFPRRADPRDVICGAPTLEALAPGARVATSSLRREAQIRATRDDLEVVGVRGNVDTRLRKLGEGSFDALVLALAGLQRLGREAEAGGVLDELVPAAGQGALAIEARASRIGELDDLDDADTRACVTAERELVHALGASCNTPVGAHARVVEDGRLELTAWVGRSDGSVWLRDRIWGGPDGTGRELARRMFSAGAAELLR
jgi:hydroxymethylbilane synthase